MQHYRRAAFILILIAAAVLILTLTDPRNIPAIMLIIPFVLFFVILFYLLDVLFKMYIPALGKGKNKKRTLYAGIGAALPVFLLVLQSIGQLTTRDIITLIILAAVSGFYITRFSFLQK